ncbi:AAA family ATPase, partial [Levilactobacillus brevis]
MSVTNYRILRNVSISFDGSSNYLVGKNNIGKTSTIELLSTL